MRVEWFIGDRPVRCLNVPGVSSLLTAVRILETFYETNGVTLWPNELLVCGDVSVLWYDGENRMTIQFSDGVGFDHSNYRMNEIAERIQALGWIE